MKILLKKHQFLGNISVNYKKYSPEERYSEEFFKENKLAIIGVNEDTSCEYFHQINEVTYENGKTSAKISYAAKKGSYAGTLSRTWTAYMIVELPNTVTSVNFELDNSTI